MSKRLCKDCVHLKSKPVGMISSMFWCGLTGQGTKYRLVGVYPWKNKPHPKCPLKLSNSTESE